MSDTPETDEAQFGTGRVTVNFARRLERERDEGRAKLQARSRRATLDEISESVREKFDPEYEFGGRDE